jgi:hypothetical protein
VEENINLRDKIKELEETLIKALNLIIFGKKNIK